MYTQLPTALRPILQSPMGIRRVEDTERVKRQRTKPSTPATVCLLKRKGSAGVQIPEASSSGPALSSCSSS